MSTGVTGVDVEHTKALEQKATPGPWEAYPSARLNQIMHVRIPGSMHPTAWPADAEFIADARSAVPALVAAVERVQALHTPHSPGAFSRCRECSEIMPCPTIRELEISK